MCGRLRQGRQLVAGYCAALRKGRLSYFQKYGVRGPALAQEAGFVTVHDALRQVCPYDR
jgi:hypothetical protein